MTVRELVLKLTELDPDLEVMIPINCEIKSQEWGDYLDVESVEVAYDHRRKFVAVQP